MELGGQVRHCGTEHNGVAGILCQIEHHVRMTFAEQCHRRGQLFKPPAGRGREQGIDLLLYYRQRPVRGDQQPGVFGKAPVRVAGPFQLPKEETGGVRQGVRRQQVLLPPQVMDKTLDVLGPEGNAEHVPGRLRQLVGLVDDDGKAVRQDGLAACTTVDSIRQQEVVVANLEGILTAVAAIQKCAIPAILPPAVADLGNANLFPVIAAETGCLIHIQLLTQEEQCVSGSPVFLAEVQLAQPPFQPLVADVVGFALADHSLDGFCDHAICYKYSGEKGQILIPHSLLQGDAGSGNKDRPGGPQAVEYNSGHKVGIGLANACSGVAEGDAAALHGLQHPMAQSNLLRALRHSLNGE